MSAVKLCGESCSDPVVGRFCQLSLYLKSLGAVLFYKVLRADIVRILPVSKSLSAYINTESSFADTVFISLFEGRVDLFLPSQDRADKTDCFNDLHISGTAAYISLDCCLDLFIRGIRINIQKSLSAHHHTRDAETALYCSAGTECVDKGFFLFNRQPLNSENSFAHSFAGLLHA